MSDYTGNDATKSQLLQHLSAIETSPTELAQFKRQLNKFAGWCIQNKRSALPASPEAIVDYIDHLAKLGVPLSSADAFFGALNCVHRAAGFEQPLDDPAVERAWLEKLASEELKNSIQTQLVNFNDWCVQKKQIALPASSQTVSRFIRHLARQETPFMDVRYLLLAIELAHYEAGFVSPTHDERVKKLEEGYYEHLISSMAKKMLLSLKKKGDIWAIRDALLVSLVSELGFKASELASLKVENVQSDSIADPNRDDDVIRVEFPSSDEPVLYYVVPRANALSPAPLLKAWLDRSGIRAGALFRCISKDGQVLDKRFSPRTAESILRRAAKTAGLMKGFSAHELFMFWRGGRRKIHVQK